MKSNTLKVAAIHDISGVGRCSLTVILPVLSALGVQVCPVPTAVLSSHTGGFTDMAVCDLTDYIPSALEHYKRLKYPFDCIYSGYLASARQVDCCLDFFGNYKNSLKIVDPVMADNGVTYSMHTPELCARMRELVAVADIITPNITEAAILLGENPLQPDLSFDRMKDFLSRLSALGPNIVIITSVFGEGGHYNICCDRKQGKFWKIPFNHINANYPGTGDIFASVLTGFILRGESVPRSVSRAASFLETAIKTTASRSTDLREGIAIESCLQLLR